MKSCFSKLLIYYTLTAYSQKRFELYHTVVYEGESVLCSFIGSSYIKALVLS